MMWSRRSRPDAAQRNRAGLDFMQADADRRTPVPPGEADFVNVENMRRELFPQEFPEGPYGAPPDAVEAGGSPELAALDGVFAGALESGRAGGGSFPGMEVGGGTAPAEDSGGGEDGGDGDEGGDEDAVDDDDPFDPRMIFFFDGAG
ncbi:MAG: hypothetical protein IMW98_00165 [Firmicutes bacterium]|nr:hypothetical protein [Bacillota bacterium]